MVVGLALYGALFLSSAPAAEGQGSIRGVLYVSYPGDLSFDVMFGADVDVLLINGDGTVEKDFESLKQQRVPPIRAQENAVTKAIGEARSATGAEKAKEKRETLKRENEKLEKLRSEYEREVTGLLAKTAIQKTKTDKKGNFKFAGLSPGRYLLHARYELRGTESKYFWFHAVDAKPEGEVEVTLNKSTAIHPYD